MMRHATQVAIAAVLASASPVQTDGNKDALLRSRHNFAEGGTVDSRPATEQRACTFCHTPASKPGAAVWGDRDAALAEYGRFSSSSKLCLSCHEGTVALGSMSDGNIQCIECHEPHDEFIDPAVGKFLVQSNAKSALCLTCHGSKGSRLPPAISTDDPFHRTAHGGVPASLPGNAAPRESSAPSWPPPPAKSRIRFVRAFSSGRDFSASKPRFLKGALKKLLGSEEPELSLMSSMRFPYGVATDSRGRVIVADSRLRAVHVFDPASHAYNLIGQLQGARLVSPIGVATDAQDNIYVSDSMEGKVFVFDPRGKVKYVIGQPEGRYKRPTGIAIDQAAGLLYVADTIKNEIVVTDLQGRDIFRFGRRGEGAGEFNAPTQLCLGGDRLYVTDALNARVQIFDLHGKYAGSLGRLGRSAGEFDKPKGVAVDSDGHVYVVEGLHDVVQILDINGNFLMSFGGTGGGAGEFYLPTAIHIDGNDNIYVADSYNSRIQVFRYLKAGGLNGGRAQGDE